MDRWMDRWKGGQIDGWMDGWIDKQIDRQMDRWTDRWIDTQIEGFRKSNMARQAIPCITPSMEVPSSPHHLQTINCMASMCLRIFAFPFKQKRRKKLKILGTSKVFAYLYLCFSSCFDKFSPFKKKIKILRCFFPLSMKAKLENAQVSDDGHG